MTKSNQATGAHRADGGVVVEGQTENEPMLEREPLYERAEDVDMSNLMPTWLPHRFAEELVKETDTPWTIDQFRLAECHNRHSEDGLEILLVAEDATRLFIGEDPTARDSNGLFGYIISPDDRLPLVRTTQEALDLLKPAQAAAAEMDNATPLRQGEWFLVPTDAEPVSRVISGEVASRPFGGSPLENHVPTEYGLGVTEAEFLEGFDAICPDVAPHAETAGDAFRIVAKGHRIAELEDVELETDLPTFEDLRQLAEPIYVRGTLRHRDNDHYMERLGDGWHLAVTHDVDVFTIDTSDLQTSRPTVRLD
jgi:hypothetical protein